MISTRLTELLDIEAPVMLAGMGGVSYHELAAAVSNAGGFGCLGASTMSDEVMVEEIACTTAATDKPFGVDLLTAAGDMTDKVRAIIAGGASVFVAGLGVPRDVVEQCHDCLLYTSDAADDLLCVDLGGRRIITKKKTHTTTQPLHDSRLQLEGP